MAKSSKRRKPSAAFRKLIVAEEDGTIEVGTSKFFDEPDSANGTAPGNNSGTAAPGPVKVSTSQSAKGKTKVGIQTHQAGATMKGQSGLMRLLRQTAEADTKAAQTAKAKKKGWGETKTAHTPDKNCPVDNPVET